MSLNSEELSKMLDEAIRNEEYEKAAKIRDEIDKRN
jgi:protein-arginine kinase activator protein McsA